MILARLFSLRCLSIKEGLSPLRNTSCMVLMVYKQTTAKQLGLPEPPKGPVTPYLRFVQHHKKEIHERFPDMSNQEVRVQLEHMWHQLSFNEKNKWSQQFDREKMAHNIKYQNYLKTLNSDQIQIMKDLKKKHDLKKKIVLVSNEKRGIEVEKPKSPGNAFTLYLKTLDRGETKLKEFVHTAACKWNNLTKEEKNSFRKKAKTLEEQYQNELSFWEMKMLKIGRVDLIERHRQFVELKNSAAQSSSKNIEEHASELTPQAATSDGSATCSSRIIEEQNGEVNLQSVKREAPYSLSDNLSKRYIHKIIFNSK